LPEAYYDPRSLGEGDVPRASLHAKCMFVDSQRTYVGSANFTEGAQLRVITSAETALAVERYFDGFIGQTHRRRLSLRM
jgi:phosphatidylserine/phosphatidylglycerophosphate/cardiolipin synthase-like enzyme